MEVLRGLKSDPRTKVNPVVILTSSKEQKDVVESYHVDVSSYIVKLMNLERFAEAVREPGFTDYC